MVARRLLAALICSFLVLATVLIIYPSTYMANSETKSTITVGLGGDYTNIQDAVDNATAGDVIEVFAGVYNEQVTVDKQLTIRGNGEELGSLINGSGNNNGLVLEADGCVVTGMSVIWTMYGYGIYIGGNNCTIEDCYQAASYCGIMVDNATGTVIKGCDISYNSIAGICLNGSTECLVMDNLLEHNNAYIGDPCGVVLIDSDDNIVKNCTIQLIYGDGIALYYGSENNAILECDVRFNIDGIDIQESDGNIIFENYCDSNTNGIQVSGSTNTNVSGNTCNDNSYGILLETASGSKVTENTCNNNDVAGIYLASSTDNVVTRNTIENNTMSLTHGIFLDSNCTTNKFFHNILKANNHGNVQAIDNGLDNSWDDGVQGNYWDDWQSPDADEDGIVDKPYEVGGLGQSTDNFPLTEASITNGGVVVVDDDDFVDDDDNITDDDDDLKMNPFFLPALALVVVLLIIILLLFKRFKGKEDDEDGGGPALRHI